MGEDVGEGEREAGGSTERDRNAGKKSPSSEVVEEGGRGGGSGSLLWGWREECRGSGAVVEGCSGETSTAGSPSISWPPLSLHCWNSRLVLLFHGCSFP